MKIAPRALLFTTVLGACSGRDQAPETPAPAAQTAPEYTAEVYTSDYHIDKLYPSMLGPRGRDELHLGNPTDPELVWIVGYDTEVVNAQRERVSQEFMCHANLDFDVSRYYDVFPTRVPLSGRVFTLSQGQETIRFPDGFGIPYASTEPLVLSTQVLNLNLHEPDLHVKHHVEVRYVRDRETNPPMRPLFQSAVQGFKALGDARYYGIAQAEAEAALHGEGCGVGMAAVDGDIDPDRLGQEFTAHWVVEPGVETNRTNVTRFMNLPYDTTAHYIAVHLHPFAEYIELIDLTTGSTVYKSEVRPATDRVGILEVEHFTSAEGLPFFKDHEYELVSHYNNTSGENVDSMAVMYIYFLDKTFGKPQFAATRGPSDIREEVPEG